MPPRAYYLSFRIVRIRPCIHIGIPKDICGISTSFSQTRWISSHAHLVLEVVVGATIQRSGDKCPKEVHKVNRLVVDDAAGRGHSLQGRAADKSHRYESIATHTPRTAMVRTENDFLFTAGKTNVNIPSNRLLISK